MYLEKSEYDSDGSEFYFALSPVIPYTVSGTEVFPGSEENANGLWIVLSGKGTLTEKASGKKEVYRELSFISKNAANEYIIDSDSDETLLLYARYDLYVAVDWQADGQFLSKKYQLLIHEFNSNLNSIEMLSSEISDYIKSTLELIRLEKYSSQRMYDNLKYIITVCAKRQFKEEMSVFSNVSAVAIFSENQPPFTENTIKLEISDVAIGLKQQSGGISANATAFYSEHIFVEMPQKPELYSRRYTEAAPVPHCRFESFVKGRFKIWLFPMLKNRLSIINIMESGVISFRLKCNMACNLTIGLYSVPSYSSVPYSFSVKEPNTWAEYTIRLKKSKKQDVENPAVRRALNYIQAHYFEKINVTDIADHVLISPNYLSGLFHREMGQTIPAYINFCRINLAKQLLSESDDSITNIASRVGYFDSAHFLKTFKKIVGISPKEYRKNNGNKTKNKT